MQNTDSTRIEFPALWDARYPVHKIADQLEPYLRALVEKIHPEKIILFGSQAYGEPTIHSDVDLLVVRKGRSGKESNLEIRQAFWDVDAPPTSFTLLSRTPEEMSQRLADGSPIDKDIVEKGVLLYAA
jgi:predicted nucleotidyltransferase